MDNSIFKSIEDDINLLHDFMQQNLESQVPLIKKVTCYALANRGKHMRPKILMLIAKTLNYQGNHHVTLGAIIEFIHIATLLHDDVVDESDFRRGQASANKNFGNSASILVGDFLFSRAFQLMVNIDKKEIFSILADTTNAITEGEVLQLMHCGNIDLTVENYYQIIQLKTAVLFRSAAWLGALISNADTNTIEIVKSFGNHLGMAFQIIDDLLDYTADKQTLGKSLGDDLKEGKLTLPLIKALQLSNDSQRTSIQAAIKKPTKKNLLGLIDILHQTDAINSTRNVAREFIDQAISDCKKLPENNLQKTLIFFSENSLHRTL